MFDRVGFFRVITPCQGTRDHRRPDSVDARPIYFRRRWKLATTYTSRLSSLIPFLGRSCSGRESTEIYQKARTSRGIFLRSPITPPPRPRVRIRRMESHAATKICRCAKNRKWTSRGPLKIRGEHPPRSPVRRTISVDFLAFSRSATSPVNDPFMRERWWTLDVLLIQENTKARLYIFTVRIKKTC